MMKLKYLNVITMVSFALLTSTSCSESTEQKMENEADTAMTALENRVDEVRSDMDEYRDENLVQDIARINSEILHLLALAQQKGTAADVKSTGKKWEAHHTKMGEEVTALAATKGYKLNADNSENKDALDNDNPGADWDKRWARKLTDDHDDLVRKLEKGVEKATDADLKTWVTNALPAIKEHQAQIMAMHDKMK